MNKLLGFCASVAVGLTLIGCMRATADAPAASADGKPGAKKGLAIGDAAPEWSGLAGIDDKKHDLKELKKAKAVVVVFTCNHCPVAKAYEDRLVELDKEFGDKEVELVAINVNNGESDRLPAMKERAEEKGFEFQYLYDPSQKIGREFGAMVTPHAFVLDKDRKLAYKGAIDDSQDPANVKDHYVRNALEELLAGKPVTAAETKQFGCGIGYE